MIDKHQAIIDELRGTCESLDAVAERERCAEMRRFIVAAMTHLRDNGDFKARDELLAWGARALAAQEGGE